MLVRHFRSVMVIRMDSRLANATSSARIRKVHLCGEIQASA
jgi:hypothetical protein